MTLSNEAQQKVNGLVNAINNKVDSSISNHNDDTYAHQELFNEVDASTDLTLNNFLDDLADEIAKE